MANPDPRTAAVTDAPAVTPTALDDALAGRRTLWLAPRPSGREGGLDPAEVAVVVATSGSTSATPSLVALGARSLRAAVEATHARLGGPGAWLATLPADHVAGFMVTLRAHLGGTARIAATPGPFRPGTFAADAARLPPGRAYVSLVPTQLHRVLGDADATEAARRFDAILVGGAALPPTLRRAAERAGLPVVTTYGMTETCGGCVYDGVPLDGVGLTLAEGGRVVVTGDVVAAGYLTASGLEPFGGAFPTSDRGQWLPDGRLEILGRIDDVVVTGGVNVDPAAVEHLVATVPGITEVAVVGVPDAEWGQVLVAAVVVVEGTDLEEARRAAQALVTDRLGRAHAPRHLIETAALPRIGPGKLDRRATARLMTDALRRP